MTTKINDIIFHEDARRRSAFEIVGELRGRIRRHGFNPLNTKIALFNEEYGRNYVAPVDSGGNQIHTTTVVPVRCQNEQEVNEVREFLKNEGKPSRRWNDAGDEKITPLDWQMIFVYTLLLLLFLSLLPSLTNMLTAFQNFLQHPFGS